MEGCRIRGQNLNKLIDIWKYFSGLYSAGCPLSEHFKGSWLPHKRERTWYFSWTLHFYSALISLHPRLFSYLQGKKPPRSIIFASLFKQFVVILPSAGQHVQYNVCIHQSPLAFSTEPEPPFSRFLAQFKAFFSLLSGLLMRLV